ncbi:hypothetical protein RJ640_028734, partial [Escallonia rubra]
MEENRIVRQRTKMYYQQNKEEMDSLEQFFKDQVKIICNARKAKEDNFEKIQQEEHEMSSGKVARLVELGDREMEAFVKEREKVLKIHGHKKVAMKRRHWEEEVELERELTPNLPGFLHECTAYQSSVDLSLDAIVSHSADFDAIVSHSADPDRHLDKFDSDLIMFNVKSTSDLADR